MALKNFWQSLNCDVSGVSAVQASHGAGLHRYGTDTAAVPGVSGTGCVGAGDTADTSQIRQPYQPKPAWIKGYTPDTADTCQKINVGEIAANDAQPQPSALLSDGCWPHGDGWTDAEIDRFNGRVVAFTGRGVGLAQSEALAEKLVYRDRDGDDRRLCLECGNLARNGRCVAAGRGQIAGASTYLEPVPTILQRCEGFRA